MSRPSTVASIKERATRKDTRATNEDAADQEEAGSEREKRDGERARERKRMCATLNLRTRRPDKKLCLFLREREIDGERVCDMEEDGIMGKDRL